MLWANEVVCTLSNHKYRFRRPLKTCHLAPDRLHSVSTEELLWSTWTLLKPSMEFGAQVRCRKYPRSGSMQLSSNGCNGSSVNEPFSSQLLGFCECCCFSICLGQPSFFGLLTVLSYQTPAHFIFAGNNVLHCLRVGKLTELCLRLSG